MNNNSRNNNLSRTKLKRIWFSARLWIIFLIGWIGIVAALSLPGTTPDSGIVLEVGDVAAQDILAPARLSFSSEVLTQEARDEAAATIQDIYDPPDGSIVRIQVEGLRSVLEYVDTVRADTNASDEERLSDLVKIEDIRLDSITAQRILDLTDTRGQVIRLEGVNVLEQVMRSEIREDQLEEARRTVPALVGISLSEDQAELVVTLTTPFVIPNSFFNAEATQAAREEARDEVTEVQTTYAAGETIIGRGDVVEPLHIETLQAYGLLKTPDPWLEIGVRGLLVLTLGISFGLYLFRIHPEQLENVLVIATLTALFVLSTVSMQFMIPDRTVLPYLFPAAVMPILLTILIGPGLGILGAMITGAIAGFLAPRGLELAIYVMFSGAMGALVIGRAERLASFFWAGVSAAATAVAVVIIFRVPDPSTDLIGKASLLGAGVVSGLLSASLGFGLLLLIGSVLGITTSLQLIELARPDHPLLQLILRNAPGTYQHSLQVANLAEQAARSVGANPLLTRVGALYHDAGKALRPQYYIENQVPGQNVHEQLDPATSAGVIVEHVSAGLELAQKYRIPEKVQAFIPEHHGTLETAFQYRSAVESAGGDSSMINHADFEYPGPKPRSKETALLMLADGVEAKARADTPKNEAEIDELVRWVINDRMEQGQLSRVDLTFKDLDTVRRSFVSTLKGIYHPRIVYPEDEPVDAVDKEQLEEKKLNDEDDQVISELEASDSQNPA
jgi:putative nucleotidyltransferase with HDIG domain